jgi:hypothetical protein
MFHQMHCLQMICSTIIKGHVRHHVFHCLNILHQESLCASNIMIATFDEPQHEIRVGALHVCQDWEKVYDFIEEISLSISS